MTCTENPLAPRRGGEVRLGVVPRFNAFARFSPITLDSVTVIVVRPPSDTLKVVGSPFNPNSQQLQLTVTSIPLLSSSEDLVVILELYGSGTLLFRGTDTVQVTSGAAAQADSIPVVYKGPGSQIMTLALAPRDTTIGLGAVLAYRLNAVDSQQAPVTSFYASWSATAGAMSAAGGFTAPGKRDTVTIAATTPSGIRDSTRVFVIAAASTLAKSGGDHQTAPFAARLPLPLAVEVTGTDGLPVPGVKVGFTATTGGGLVDSSTASTDAQGVARTGATLGPTVGVQTFTASATGLTSVVFADTALAPAPGRTWTGAVSSDWSVAGNWNPALVPDNTQDVVIPSGTPHNPQITSSGSAKSLTVNSGATLNLQGFNFQAAGNVFADGAITGTGAVQLATTAQIRGTMPALILSGSVTAAGPVTIAGNVTVTGGLGDLVAGGQIITVGGNLTVQSGALLTMTNGSDQVTVAGNAAFSAGNELGQLTAGTLSIGGNLSQVGTTSGASYHPSGNHLTVLTGTSPTVAFQNPGTTVGASQFENLTWAGSGTLTLGSNVFAHGTFTNGNAAAVTVTSASGLTLQVATQVGNGLITFNNVRLVLNQTTSGPLGLSNATFQNMPTTSAQLTVSHPGAATPFTFNSVTFATTPQAPNGFYLDVTDVDGATSGQLVINMVNPSPSSPGAFARVAGGAAVNWPAGLIWAGSISNDWSVAGNWSPTQVPTTTNDVVVPSGTPNSPRLSAASSAKTLTVNAGATLNLNGFNLQVSGDVAANGQITGSGAVQIIATGQVRGSLASLTAKAPVTGASNLAVTGNLSVFGAGASYSAGGHVTTVTGNLVTDTSGVLIMTNPLDTVRVISNASFGGGSTSGQLTAGVLQVGGGFTQLGATATSFAAGGNHVTQLIGAGTQQVAFGSPASSHFQALDLSPAANVSLASNVTVLGQLISLPAGNPDTVRASGPGPVLTAGGANINKLVLDGVPLVLSGGTITSFSNTTFRNQSPTGTQLTVNNVGQGAPFAFSGLTFQTTPTAGGFYLSANDLDGATSGLLTINVTASTPASGAPFVQVSNGAVVNWPPTPIWIGAVSSNWSIAGNWSSGLVPSPTDSVVVAAATNQPVLSGNTSVGAVTVQGGTLTLNGHTLTVARTFATTGSGTVTMTNAVDSLLIGGNASFGGGSELNLLSAGTTQIAGNLTQLSANSPDSYNATGTHLTLFTGSPTITFASPDSGSGSSHFQLLRLPRPGTVTLGSDVVTVGRARGNGIGLLTIQGSGQAFTMAFGAAGGGNGSDSGQVVLNNVRLVIRQTTSAVDTLDNFTIQGLSSAATQLTINHPGSSTSGILIRNATFSVVPTTGFYISATDVNPGDGAPLIVEVVGSSPASGAPHIQTAGGAVVNWPAAPTWVGEVSSDWNTGGNWSTGVVPAATDSVVIATATNLPILTQAASVGAINYKSGTLLLNGQTLTVARTLLTTGGGAVSMHSPSDLLDVQGNAIFGGGSENGALTDGLLRIAGNFTQLTGNLGSFAATPPHTTELTAANPIISFQSPGSSYFGNLTSSLYSPTLTLNSNVTVLGFLSGGDGFGGTVNGTCGSVLAVQSIQTGHATLDCVSLEIDDPTGQGSGLNSVTFINQLSTADQLTIHHPGFATQAFTLSAISWTALSSGSTGSYVNAIDADGVSPPLVINVSSTDPGNGPAFTKASGGAVVNWPSGGIKWTGAVSSDWSNAANWSTFTVPTASDSVVIPNVSQQPVLTGSVVVGSVNVAGGNVTFNGNALGVSRNFATTGLGTLTMSNQSDALIVAGNVLFDGAAGGQITAGTISVGGNFTQAHTTNTASFTPSGINVVSLNGTAPQTLTFADSTTSFFNTLIVTNTSPTGVTVNSRVKVTSSLSLSNTVVTASDATTTGTGFDVGGTISIVNGQLSLGRLFVGGTLNVDAPYSVANTIFTGTAQQVPTGLPYQDVTTIGTDTVFGGLTTTGNLVVNGSLGLGPGAISNVGGSVSVAGGKLNLAGSKLNVVGDFSTSGSGTVTMQLLGDTLDVTGNASFGGGSTSGLLTNGLLKIGGDFVQSAVTSTTSFAPSGLYTTHIGSTAAHVIDFGSPGSGSGGSHFQNLNITGASGGLSLTVNTIVDSAFIAVAGAGPSAVISGPGTSLTARQWQVSSLTVDNVPMILQEGGGTTGLVEQFSGVTFQNFPTTGTTMMTVVGPGGLFSARPSFATIGVNFQTLPAGNLYVSLTSTNDGSFVLTMTGSNQGQSQGGNGAALSNPPNQTIGPDGAQILWP